MKWIHRCLTNIHIIPFKKIPESQKLTAHNCSSQYCFAWCRSSFARTLPQTTVPLCITVSGSYQYTRSASSKLQPKLTKYSRVNSRSSFTVSSTNILFLQCPKILQIEWMSSIKTTKDPWCVQQFITTIFSHQTLTEILSLFPIEMSITHTKPGQSHN